MRWQCTLFRRWLPGYLEGDLPAFWRRRLKAHMAGCPGCRQELASLEEVVAALKASPVADPGPEFWQQFSRELHLKLAQAAQEAPAAPEPVAARRFRIPYYLLGAPALAVLVLWAATQLLEPSRPVLTQKAAPTLAEKAQPAPVREAQPSLAQQAPKASAPESMVYVALGGENGVEPEEDFPSWDLDPVIADLSDQEREALLKKLRAREKDGSCGPSYSSVSFV